MQTNWRRILFEVIEKSEWYQLWLFTYSRPTYEYVVVHLIYCRYSQTFQNRNILCTEHNDELLDYYYSWFIWVFDHMFYIFLLSTWTKNYTYRLTSILPKIDTSTYGGLLNTPYGLKIVKMMCLGLLNSSTQDESDEPKHITMIPKPDVNTQILHVDIKLSTQLTELTYLFIHYCGIPILQ